MAAAITSSSKCIYFNITSYYKLLTGEVANVIVINYLRNYYKNIGGTRFSSYPFQVWGQVTADEVSPQRCSVSRSLEPARCPARKSCTKRCTRSSQREKLHFG